MRLGLCHQGLHFWEALGWAASQRAAQLRGDARRSCRQYGIWRVYGCCLGLTSALCVRGRRGGQKWQPFAALPLTLGWPGPQTMARSEGHPIIELRTAFRVWGLGGNRSLFLLKLM